MKPGWRLRGCTVINLCCGTLCREFFREDERRRLFELPGSDGELPRRRRPKTTGSSEEGSIGMWQSIWHLAFPAPDDDPPGDRGPTGGDASSKIVREATMPQAE